MKTPCAVPSSSMLNSCTITVSDWAATAAEAGFISERIYFRLSVELGNATITPAELLELQAGDIIQLGKKPEDPLDIRAEGIPKFLGSPGASRGKQAVKVTGFIKKGDV